jgi:capsid assembly protease
VNKYTRIIQAVMMTPWAMQPEKVAAMMVILERAATGEKLSAEQIAFNLAAARIHPNTDASLAKKPGAIALIPIRGLISNRASMVSDASPGMGTSTEAISANFKAAMANEDIKAIVFDVDSPGGSVHGMQELADEIHSMRGTKPMIAQVNALCASAAYWIASSADEIVVTPSGEVGSIGVIGAFKDKTAREAAKGVKTTVIAAGKYKAEGNPFEPLSDEALENMKATCEAYYGMFVDTVARNRNAKAADVRGGYGQGRALMAGPAVAAGLADRVGTLATTLARWGVNIAPQAKLKGQVGTPRLNVALRELDLLQ